MTVRFLSDFWELNKRLKRHPFSLPVISDVLLKLQGFQFATALDLNMGYYTICLDPDAQKYCTIVLPWGKYRYKRLPMGISRAPNIFQQKMLELMANLEFIRVYLDDLLILTKSSFSDHLTKLEIVLQKLCKANLNINIAKSGFALSEIEYLGYILTHKGIKPQNKKVAAKYPKNW